MGKSPSPILAQGSIPEQRCYPNYDNAKGMCAFAFPHVFVPASGDRKTSSMLVQGIRQQRTDIERALQQSGAILFRGFEVHSAADFNDILDAFGYDNFSYDGRGLADRKAVVGRVMKNNEKHSQYPLGFHNEMAYQSTYPSKIIFFCDVAPKEGAGGSTPILPGHVVYQRLEKEMPEFLEMLESKGVVYVLVLSSDPSRTRENCWQVRFQAATKEEAEKKAKEMGNHIQWNEDGTATAFLGPRSAIRMHPSSGRKMWFNSIGSTYGFIKQTPTKNAITFGDGSPMSKDLLAACQQIMEEEKTAFQWHKGDVLLLDNLAALHAREPSESPRNILVALSCD